MNTTKFNEKRFINTLEIGREYVNGAIVNPNPHEVVTALQLSTGLHAIGTQLRNVVNKEANSEEITGELVGIFKAISSTQITKDEIKQGRECVDEIVKRSAIGYGVLSGLACNCKNES